MAVRMISSNLKSEERCTAADSRTPRVSHTFAPPKVKGEADLADTTRVACHGFFLFQSGPGTRIVRRRPKSAKTFSRPQVTFSETLRLRNLRAMTGRLKAPQAQAKPRR